MKEAVMSVWALLIGLFLGFAGIGTQMIGVSAPADQALVSGGDSQVRTMEDPFGPPPPR
jgi:hypothetical protein